MAGRSGRAGVSRGEKGKSADESVKIGTGESFLILPVRVCLYLLGGVFSPLVRYAKIACGRLCALQKSHVNVILNE